MAFLAGLAWKIIAKSGLMMRVIRHNRHTMTSGMVLLRALKNIFM
jgi:hypothetical protein